MNKLIIKKLTKKYGKTVVFQDLSCQLDSKEYNFLVGPNGTGKSTLIKCLLGYLNYQGEVIKDNLNFSYAPDKISLPEYINVYNLLLLLVINRKINLKEADKKINQMLKNFSIEKYKYTPIYKLSKGTRQKVILIQCLISNSDVYIFDEPLNGLDLVSKGVFMVEIKKLKQLDKIIVISTHNINDYKFRNKRVIKFPIESEDYNDIIN